MRGIAWIRCFKDEEDNRAWVALRHGNKGFDILITVWKLGATGPESRVLKEGLNVLKEATTHFEKYTHFYSERGWQEEPNLQAMFEDLLTLTQKITPSQG